MGRTNFIDIPAPLWSELETRLLRCAFGRCVSHDFPISYAVVRILDRALSERVIEVGRLRTVRVRVSVSVHFTVSPSNKFINVRACSLDEKHPSGSMIAPLGLHPSSAIIIPS